MTHARRASAASAAVLATGVLGFALMTGTAAAATGKNCSDFATQQQAQAYFNANGGSPSNNVDGLDRDHDGFACERLPYGPAQASGGGTAQASGGGTAQASGGGTAQAGGGGTAQAGGGGTANRSPNSTQGTSGNTSQMQRMPSGAAATGGGGTAGVEDEGLIALGAASIAAGGGSLLILRRRTRARHQ